MSVQKVLEKYKERQYVVTVIWEDCNYYSGIHSVSEEFTSSYGATTGVLIKEDEDGISVSHELFEDNDVRHTAMIPKSQIRKIIRYKIDDEKLDNE